MGLFFQNMGLLGLFFGSGSLQKWQHWDAVTAWQGAEVEADSEGEEAEEVPEKADWLERKTTVIVIFTVLYKLDGVSTVDRSPSPD